jgi:hypothetical protein
MMGYVQKFRSDKATKQLLATSQNVALHYCRLSETCIKFLVTIFLVTLHPLSFLIFPLQLSGQWSPCENDDSQYDDAGIV